jgi:hypothetical protein
MKHRSKPTAWKKLPRRQPESNYPDGLYRLRAYLRHELKDQRERAARCKWYANVTKNDPPETLSHRGWVAQRLELVRNAIEIRARLRATNF